MLSTLSSTLLALTTLSQLASSLPHNHLPRAPPSYSIVNVDGGRPPSTATIIQTVLAPAPTIDDPPAAPATETILQTAVVTAPSAPAQTVIVTFEPAGPSSTSSSTSSSSTPPSTPLVSVVTVIETALQPAATEYYDNGLWKTEYPVKTFEEAVPVTSAASVLVPTSAVESVTASTFVTLPTPVPSLP